MPTLRTCQVPQPQEPSMLPTFKDRVVVACQRSVGMSRNGRPKIQREHRSDFYDHHSHHHGHHDDHHDHHHHFHLDFGCLKFFTNFEKPGVQQLDTWATMKKPGRLARVGWDRVMMGDGGRRLRWEDLPVESADWALSSHEIFGAPLAQLRFKHFHATGDFRSQKVRLGIA